MLKVYCAGLAVATGAMFVACGDADTTEQITNNYTTGLDMVSSVADLPKCTKDNEGEQVFVKDDGGIRVCSDGKWYAVAGDSESSDGEPLVCTTKALKDSSGIKIICNGDSIGVVLNGVDGKDGADGKDGTDGKDGEDGAAGAPGKQGEKGAKGDKGDAGADGEDGTDGKPGADGKPGENGSGCTIDKDGTRLAITCGSKSVTLELGEDGSPIGGAEVVLDSEQVAVSLDSVTGASQKGPFLSGSKVLVKELENGRSLTQTGNHFDGKILNDKGQFKITARMLVSQYVMLEANGYYRNEVTGGNSESPLTLFGISDVSTRNIVNINLLTHLEYDRVIYLVTKKNMKVLDAKDSAQKEVFGIFHIDNSDFSNSEDLSIAGSSDEDGALLAFSILFQGDRSVSQLTELLTRVSTAMEKEGVWDDAATKTEIADWAMVADTSGRLADIRGKVEAWGLGSMVPKFEPYIRNFWRAEYGLGECDGEGGGAAALGTVSAAKKGAAAGTKVRFICAGKPSSGDAFADGEARWRNATDFEKDTYGWKDSTDGALKKGDVTDKKYVYDSTGAKNGTKGWREAESVEEQYGGCREELFGKIRTHRGKTEAGYYRCDEEAHKWVLETNSLAIDTQLWKEGDDGFAKWGDSITSNCYVYDTAEEYNGWRQGNSSDCSLGLMGCTKAVQALGKMMYSEKNGNYYMCKNNNWNLISDDVQKNTYNLTCNADNDGSVIPGTADTWYYVCDGAEWRTASQAEYEACYLNNLCSACVESRQGEFLQEPERVCDKKEWRVPNAAEHEKQALCTAENDGEIIYALLTGGIATDWICKGSSWQKAYIYDYTLEQWNVHLENHEPEGVTFGSLEDERDGRVYRTVRIGDQVWMAENLNYADSVLTLNLKGNTWCYDDNPEKCEVMGRHYTWTAAMDINKVYQQKIVPAGMIKEVHRGICPEGWHIPNNDEWNAMGSESGGYAAQQAMGIVGWNSATNASGFAALPAGYCDDHSFSFSSDKGSIGYCELKYAGSRALFWSATEGGANGAYYWVMAAGDAYLTGYNFIVSYKRYGFSVRCLQDQN